MSAPDPAKVKTPSLKAALPVNPAAPMSCVIHGKAKFGPTCAGPAKQAWAMSAAFNTPL